MLVLATITKAESVKATGLVRSSSGSEFILNTNRINDLKTRASTKSKFRYNFNLYDRRESGTYMECDSSVATIVTAFSATLSADTLPFYYYPNADTTKTPVLTYITAESIAICYADASGASDRSFMEFYSGGGKKNTILVKSSLDQIMNIADYGTTSTT